MTTDEIVKREERALTPSQREMRDFKAQAQLVVEAGLAPQGMDAAEVAAIMLKGREEGLKPMESLQSFYPVKGRVSEMTHYLVARLREHGHSYIVRKGNADECTIEFYRRDGTQLPDWTMTFEECDEANYNKYYDQSSKQWKVKPTWKGAGQRRMLIYRTLSSGIKAYFPEVLHDVPDREPVATEGAEVEELDFEEVLKGWIRDAGREAVLSEVEDLADEVEEEMLEPEEPRFIWTRELVEQFDEWLTERALTRQEALKLAARYYRMATPQRFNQLPAETYQELLEAIDEEVNREVEQGEGS